MKRLFGGLIVTILLAVAMSHAGDVEAQDRSLSRRQPITCKVGTEYPFYDKADATWKCSPTQTAAALKVVYGQSTTVAASDTIASGLTNVVAVVCTLDDNPVAGAQFVTCQAGSSGNFSLKTWKSTATADTAQIAATTFSKKVSWVAIGS